LIEHCVFVAVFTAFTTNGDDGDIDRSGDDNVDDAGGKVLSGRDQPEVYDAQCTRVALQEALPAAADSRADQAVQHGLVDNGPRCRHSCCCCSCYIHLMNTNSIVITAVACFLIFSSFNMPPPGQTESHHVLKLSVRPWVRSFHSFVRKIVNTIF